MGVVYLIRHAQASFGAVNYDQLSKLGHRQSLVLGEALRPRVPAVHAVYAGEMLRHRQTAEPALQAWGQPPSLQVHAGFNEFDHAQVLERYKPAYGNRVLLMADMARTLQPRKAFQAAFDAAAERWLGGQHDAEYTETWPQFQSRCVAALQDVIAALGSGKTALVFTSGGPIAAIAQHLLGLPNDRVFALNRTLVNAAVTKVVYSETAAYLSSLNDHSHFEGERRELLTYR
jgi:broad specificity phosphatase PhoE